MKDGVCFLPTTNLPTLTPHRSPPPPRPSLSITDFELVRRIGDGSYSQVLLGLLRSTGAEYALKVMEKQFLIRHNMAQRAVLERSLLSRLRHPGIVRLAGTLQDAHSLYLVLEHCPAGELYDQLRLQGPLPEATAAHYLAELVDVLGALRAQGVVHRDLKPENVLLDARGHLRLIDFGSACELARAAAPAAAPPLLGRPSLSRLSADPRLRRLLEE
ncbi:protein kinase, partial [Helicosporidium sp. ATCC 50920]